MTADQPKPDRQDSAKETQPNAEKLSAELRRALEELIDKIYNQTCKQKLWAERFSEADRLKFNSPRKKVLATHNIIDMWRVARGTPTWNQCIVEVAHALGFINAPRRESLLHDLGVSPPPSTEGNVPKVQVPHWDDEARELRYRGKVVRVVKRPKQAYNIVTILRAFQAAGWPPRIDDPHGRKPNNETRRRDMSNLNKGLDTSLLKFECDGDGTGFLWKKTPRPKAKKKAKRPKQ